MATHLLLQECAYLLVCFLVWDVADAGQGFERGIWHCLRKLRAIVCREDRVIAAPDEQRGRGCFGEVLWHRTCAVLWRVALPDLGSSRATHSQRRGVTVDHIRCDPVVLPRHKFEASANELWRSRIKG